MRASPHEPRGGSLVLALIAGFVMPFVVACGRRESSPPGSGAETATEGPPEVRFTAREFAFAGPDTIAAGMATWVLHNAGARFHDLQLLHVSDGRSAQDVRVALRNMRPTDPFPPWTTVAGGIGVTEPGAEARATLMVTPGDYVVLCTVYIPDKVPHVAKGMIAPLTVVPATAPSGPPPTADLTLTEVDYAFAFSAAPTAGHHVVEVRNSGTQDHAFQLVRLGAGKTPADLARWRLSMEGPFPGTFLGGTRAMRPGQVEYVTLDLTPGDYLTLCDVVDPKSGKRHSAMGMVARFSIPPA